SQALRADHRRRYLAAGHLLVTGQSHFGVELREARDRNQVIYRIEAEADNIEIAIFGEGEWKVHDWDGTRKSKFSHSRHTKQHKERSSPIFTLLRDPSCIFVEESFS